MDIRTVLHQVTRWCEEQTAVGDPDEIEVECHATVWITIGESSPPWDVRWQRRTSAGANSPIAQLRYDPDRREWALHHGGEPPQGWCDADDAIVDRHVEPLLEEGPSGTCAGVCGEWQEQ